MNLLSLREVSTLPIGMATSLRKGMLYLILALLMVMSTDVFAHAVAQGDRIRSYPVSIWRDFLPLQNETHRVVCEPFCARTFVYHAAWCVL